MVMPAERVDFAESLLDWYDNNRRILPWREDPAPYHVWLSEIMLQQTRVEAVKRYYARFLETLPDIVSLAAAPEDTYLKLWEGLGYYSRVRNLHKGAVTVMEQYGGEMPHTSAELQRIPGIGPYTSAAIASIAFGERVPAVDGNLLRVFARLTAYAEDIKSDAAKKAATGFYQDVMDMAAGAAVPEPAGAETGASCASGRPVYDRPGDLNQALMDLGATVCLPNAQPVCDACPLRKQCLAHLQGRETDYPVMPAKKARKEEDLTVFLIHDAERIALRKRPPRGLLAGLYEFPNTPGHLTEDEALSYVRSIGFSPLHIRRLTDVKHIFTHKEWHMQGYEILADELAELHPDTKRSPGIFLAQIREIRDIYSVPSAFAAYSSLI
ncbi:MAG: A/G-specific adenine glycosylase [Lachnospiraceae bacterium]|nr:A/G-specific adenine glycosylase [Lachnospiraceae bacterium]